MKEIINEGVEVLKHANTLVQALIKTFEAEIGKIDVKFTEGKAVKQARPIVAQQLRSLADFVEHPEKGFKIVDIKRPKSNKK